MINVYLLGHGFMDKTRTITLIHPLITYVKDGHLYDGRKTRILIDNGTYDASDTDSEVTTHAIDATIPQHYFSSDMGSFNDINTSKYWATSTRVSLGTGTLIKFSDTLHVYASQYSPAHGAIRLSDLLVQLQGKFGNDFQLHWTACRSIIEGSTETELLQSMNGGDLVHVDAFVTA
jgi:hypothetical protein